MKRYCKYCEEESVNGGCNKDILDNELKLNGQPLVSQEVFVQDNELALFINNYESGRCYVFKTHKIKYCPMCGKELKKQIRQSR